jgi:hypothetical protein
MSELTKSSTDSAFHEVTKQLIEASIAAWPEDQLLPIALAQWSLLDPSESLKLFETHFGHLANSLTQKDQNALFEAGQDPALLALNIKEKYLSANESTQKTLWTYIGHMCRFGTMNKLYEYIPKNVMAAVTDAAHDLKTRLDSGELDTSSINPMDLGKSVMSKFKPEELESMMKSLMSNKDAMNTIMAQMSSVMESGNGSPDMSSLLKFLGPSS